jgi:predicted dehydrogenase
MSHTPLRIGIIGADTQASWAGASHIPAIQAHPGLTLTAVATRREDSARAAAEAFGAVRWYADPYALIADEEIDVVTVAVKVPAHRPLVLAALKAGKAVYCESPLGATLADTEAMAAAASSSHTAIGLQGRHNPSVRRAMDIIASGRLGTVLSANIRATTFGYGPTTLSAYDYFNKAASGASFLTITAAHVLDLIEAVLGDIAEVDARTRLIWPTVAVADTGETSAREIPDHLDLIAWTDRGVSATVQVLAGVEHDPHFVMEVRGSAGTLSLRGQHLAGAQVGDLLLSASVPFDPPESPLASGVVGPTAAEFWTGASINVGELYASLARDIATGTHQTPGFAHALHNSRLVAAVERAAQTGQRQRIASDTATEQAT